MQEEKEKKILFGKRKEDNHEQEWTYNHHGEKYLTRRMKMIERKIGERFKVDGKLVECVESNKYCYSKENGKPCIYVNHFCGNISCTALARTDNKFVCYVEVKE